MSVETLAPLVAIMAAERTTARPDLFEDARQEGLIAVWRLETSHPDASPAYRATVARRAVGDVLRGRPSFGAESRRGWQDAHGSAGPLVDDEGMFAAEPGQLESGFGRVESGALRAAVRELPESERLYVWLRFWEGFTVAEVAAELGVSLRSLEDLWRRVRPVLREAVAA